MHARLAPDRDVHAFKGQRASKLQFVGEHARDFLVVVLELRRRVRHFRDFRDVRLWRSFWLGSNNVKILHLDAPRIFEQHAHSSQGIILFACRRLISNEVSRFGLRVHEGNGETGGMLIFYCDRHAVHAWSEGCRDIFGNISADMSFFWRIYSEDLCTVHVHDEFGRPHLSRDVAIHFHAPAEDALILLPPCLQVWQVEVEGDRRSHEHMLSQDAGGFNDGIERIHMPEPAQWAPKILQRPGVLGSLQVKVLEAIRALQHSRCEHADVSDITFL
mmetsp:Transcript_40225/g.93133  ORF Transcript_40225/g.93133 Transcript_40225/m.93133 type:complete len:274 (-) Transcript_40225:1347-2168(-)